MDTDELSRPCTVCQDGLECQYRTYRIIAYHILQDLLKYGCDEKACYAIKDALDLKNWEFEKDYA